MNNTSITDNMAGAAVIESDQRYNLRKLMIERNYPEYLKLAEDCISQNLALAKGIDFAYYENSNSSGTLLDGPEALRPILFRKAVNYTYSAFCLLKNGHVDATYSCIRSSVEHIWRIYFLTLAENDKKMLLYKEEINKDRKPEELPESKRLTPDETEQIEKFRHFSPGYLRNYLYTKDKLLSMNKVYDNFSTKTHPSIHGSMAELEFGWESVEDMLKLLIGISLSLTMTGLEIYPININKMDDKQLKRLVERVGDAIGSLVDLFPNNSNFVQKLRVSVYTTRRNDNVEQNTSASSTKVG